MSLFCVVHHFHTFIKLRDHSSDVESTSYFLGCYDVEKGTDISEVSFMAGGSLLKFA